MNIDRGVKIEMPVVADVDDDTGERTLMIELWGETIDFHIYGETRVGTDRSHFEKALRVLGYVPLKKKKSVKP